MYFFSYDPKRYKIDYFVNQKSTNSERINYVTLELIKYNLL